MARGQRIVKLRMRRKKVITSQFNQRKEISAHYAVAMDKMMAIYIFFLSFCSSLLHRKFNEFIVDKNVFFFSLFWYENCSYVEENGKLFALWMCLQVFVGGKPESFFFLFDSLSCWMFHENISYSVINFVFFSFSGLKTFFKCIFFGKDLRFMCFLCVWRLRMRLEIYEFNGWNFQKVLVDLELFG